MVEQIPKIGIGLIVQRGNTILLGQRKGSHGAGEFGGPGGHFEHGESLESSILRELKEEAGPDLRVKDLGLLCITNLTRYMPKHYLDVGMVAEYVDGEPVVMEPDKLTSWGWYDLDNLPSPLFGCVANYVIALKSGKRLELGVQYFTNEDLAER
ncbi:MAG: NUDIX domain-containing protein [Candidatus Saccharimonadales bacterium]